VDCVSADLNLATALIFKLLPAEDSDTERKLKFAVINKGQTLKQDATFMR
jgi:hypothetical protein